MIADIDGDPEHEIVAAAMDRHVYAWNPGNGSAVPGFPTLVVDPAKVASIDAATHQVTFAAGSGSEQQGAIVDTPAVGDLDADADDTGPDELPEIVVGTNEEYAAAQDGGVNADQFNAGLFTVAESLGVLSPGNSRLYALKATGDADANPNPSDAIRPGWPTKIGIALTELLPVVGEGITGSPAIGPVNCPSGGERPQGRRDAGCRLLVHAQPERHLVLRPDGRPRHRAPGGLLRQRAEVRRHHALGGRAPGIRPARRRRPGPVLFRAGDGSLPGARPRRSTSTRAARTTSAAGTRPPASSGRTTRRSSTTSSS